MSEQISADNSMSAGADNVSGQPVSAATETGSMNGQAQGGAPDADLFKGIDPNQLTPKERATYDSMLRDYREKTGKLSETIKSESAKAAESYRSKAELYDQIASQEAFVNKWNDYVKEQEKVQNAGGSSNDPMLTKMERQLQEMSQKMQLSEMSQIRDSFADAQNEKGELLHPDFDQLNSISIGQLKNGDQAEEFSLLRACIELSQGSPQEKLATGYKMAKAVKDQIFEEGRKAGMGRLQTKVMNGSKPPTNAMGEIVSMTDKKPKNAREAMELARKGVMVSRD